MKLRGRLFWSSGEPPVGEVVRVYDCEFGDVVAEVLTDGIGVWKVEVRDDVVRPLYLWVRGKIVMLTSENFVPSEEGELIVPVGGGHDEAHTAGGAFSLLGGFALDKAPD